MTGQLLAILLVLPFALMFLYAGFHEFQRYKAEGRAKYGLVFNEETGTTHVTGIPEHEDGYDPAEFDPGAFNERDTDGDDAAEDADDDKSGNRA
ncbi:hypothetical protein [Hoeflea olei]|uniref:Uncharacterized protein n=1 Tax=Hoeflea olei TaxID=1480615 RepID=A0A1C1YYN1_9HYPH|nr:hypothetical protein [Hoeflea olei]OCW58674.1 hypothetical protein AWJ14_00100 [Hoeflea olei]